MIDGSCAGPGVRARSRDEAPAFPARALALASVVPDLALPPDDDQQSHRCREIAARARRPEVCGPPPEQRYRLHRKRATMSIALAAAQRDRFRDHRSHADAGAACARASTNKSPGLRTVCSEPKLRSSAAAPTCPGFPTPSEHPRQNSDALRDRPNPRQMSDSQSQGWRSSPPRPVTKDLMLVAPYRVA